MDEPAGKETTLANFQDAKQAAEGFARDTHEAYEKALDHVVRMQERNFRFAHGMVSDSVEEARQQVEANRVFSGELIKRGEQQRDAMRVVVGESVDAYMGLAFAPLTLYRERLAHAAGSAK